MEALGAEELALRAENARKVIREHGITYNIYSDSQGMDRPWELDIFPLLIPGSEWRFIEAGLIQRATLLNRILGDLFGPQELLRTGALPPATRQTHRPLAYRFFSRWRAAVVPARTPRARRCPSRTVHR